MLLGLLLQTWHELDFNLGRPEDIDSFPWSVPVSIFVALLIIALLWKARRNYLALPELPALKIPAAFEVTAVIPLLQEEQEIGRCVKSMAPSRVIVVGEPSADGSLAKAKASGAEVLPSPPAPRGVLPRPNALSAGAQAAGTNYVLFADAATWFQPNFLPSAVHYAAQNDLVLLSPFLKQHGVTASARMLAPYASAIYFSGFNPRKAQDVLSPVVYANAHCMLFLRTAYEFFGGYRSVQTSSADEIAIVQKVKRHRMKLRLIRAEKLGSVEIKWSAEAAANALRPSGSTAWLAVFTSLLLAAVLPLAVWLAYQGQWPFIVIPIAALVIALAPWYGGWHKALLSLPAVYLFQLGVLRHLLARPFRSKTVPTLP
jgi:glycosyltransferase involved in cell wall biosynthesis